eukprot:CAMPEP_0185908408 /NCGR_PEP_ID=MMETSP0196C-20130402/8837_1 /TAXON_ID=2932 /ORGANISM="Alexandrium fundyense, Strain CCMP1719" /LENGTH=45 /DNA_ID= /DNA_START= /DNA_END= /DNA_ORIENTATION=
MALQASDLLGMAAATHAAAGMNVRVAFTLSREDGAIVDSRDPDTT